jgi:hypothetical protein
MQKRRTSSTQKESSESRKREDMSASEMMYALDGSFLKMRFDLNSFI